MNRKIAHEGQPVKMLALEFAMTRPAISQHLRVLAEAGLIVEKKVGREHHYQLRATPLSEVSDWVQQHVIKGQTYVNRREQENRRLRNVAATRVYPGSNKLTYIAEHLLACKLVVAYTNVIYQLPSAG